MLGDQALTTVCIALSKTQAELKIKTFYKWAAEGVRGPPENMKQPLTLSPEAAAHWRALTHSLPKGHLESCDSGSLTAYTEALAALDHAKAVWIEEGRPLTLTHRTGSVGQHPILTVIQQQSRIIATLASKLRVCPAARTRIDKAGTGKHAPDLGEWEGLLS